jgi:hypothetical protein
LIATARNGLALTKTPDGNGTTQRSCKRDSFSRFLILLGLTGFAITEPLLAILGDNPDIFHFYNIESPSLIFVYTIVVMLVPALVLWFTTVVLGWVNRGIARTVHGFFVGLLIGLWLVQLFKWSFGINEPGVLMVFTLFGAAIFVFVYVKWGIVKSLLQVAAIAPFVAGGVFLFSSDTGSLMRSVKSEVPLASNGEKHPSVLFIMLDEFPTMGLFNEKGEIDAARFPVLSDLAKYATWYRHYSVLYEDTRHSIPSILTGNDPRPLAPTFANFPDNLFSLLAPTHYLFAFETITGLCGFPKCNEGPPGTDIEQPSPQMASLFVKTAQLWQRQVSLTDSGETQFDDFQDGLPSSSSGLEQGADDHREGAPLSTKDKGSVKRKPDRLQQFMTTFAPDNPALYFIHLELPHLAWRFYGNGETYISPTNKEDATGRNRDGGEWFTRLKEYRFLMQAQYTDLLLGKIFAQLKLMGMWDDLLVVVSADHGRSFKHTAMSRGLTPETIDDIAYVPLLIKRPNQVSGQVDDTNLMAVDIVPTIADLLEIKVPWSTSGFPAGHRKILERGDEKFAFKGKNKNPGTAESQFGKRFVYSDKENFPEYKSRWIGELPEAGSSLVLLNKSLELDRYIGRSPGEFEIRPGGSATVVDLASLRHPPAPKWPIGVVVGNLEFEPDSEKVLVSINGRFVTGSPLVEFNNASNTFIAMLPQGVLKRDNNIGIYLVHENSLSELDLAD